MATTAMRPKKPYSSRPAVWLLAFVPVQAALVFLGVQLGLPLPATQNFGTGRMLAAPAAVGAQVVMALLLLGLEATERQRPSRTILFVAVVAVALALYHWVIHMFGSEMLLALGALLLVRENARKA